LIRNNYPIKLYDDDEKNSNEISRFKEEVDFDLGKICDINKYYKQIKEAPIFISEIERKIDENSPEKIYVDDLDDPEIEIWE
jgi:hypothetical protein